MPASSVRDWVRRFRQLHVDRSHGGTAPHKPLMLLAVIDLVEDGTLQSTRVDFSPDLLDRRSAYWRAASSRFDSAGQSCGPAIR